MDLNANQLIQKAKNLRAQSIFNPKNHTKAETISKMDGETDEETSLNQTEINFRHVRINNIGCFVWYKYDKKLQECEFRIFNRLRPKPLTFVIQDCSPLSFDVDQEIRRLGFILDKPDLKKKRKTKLESTRRLQMSED